MEPLPIQKHLTKMVWYFFYWVYVNYLLERITTNNIRQITSEITNYIWNISSFTLVRYSVYECLVKLVLKNYIRLKSTGAINLFPRQQLSVRENLFQIHLKLLSQCMSCFSYSVCEFLMDLVLNIFTKWKHAKNMCSRQ